jgi:hypothetical protein
LLKQKFWQHRGFREIGNGNNHEPIVSVGVFGKCKFPDPSACAFNVESIQFRSKDIFIPAIVVDGVETDISGKGIHSPTNLLVDLGIGKIGAEEMVTVLGSVKIEFPEFNGEKPQGMFLEFFAIAGGETSGEYEVYCLTPDGHNTECSDELLNSESLEYLLEIVEERYG